MSSTLTLIGPVSKSIGKATCHFYLEADVPKEGAKVQVGHLGTLAKSGLHHDGGAREDSSRGLLLLFPITVLVIRPARWFSSNQIVILGRCAGTTLTAFTRPTRPTLKMASATRTAVLCSMYCCTNYNPSPVGDKVNKAGD
jgi:hypothetical protein